MNVVTIDPGFTGTGIAVWEDGEMYPVYNSSFSRRTVGGYMRYITKICLKYNVWKAYIEQASFMEFNKGMVTARSGSLIVLAEFIGQLIRTLETHGIVTEMVPVAKWKGNLPKVVVKRRIMKRLPKLEATNHDYDAVGIGLYIKGIL